MVASAALPMWVQKCSTRNVVVIAPQAFAEDAVALSLLMIASLHDA